MLSSPRVLQTGENSFENNSIDEFIFLRREFEDSSDLLPVPGIIIKGVQQVLKICTIEKSTFPFFSLLLALIARGKLGGFVSSVLN